MTNEELMRAYYYDPENSVEIMHQLLEQNMGLIYSIAEKVAAKCYYLQDLGYDYAEIATMVLYDLTDEEAAKKKFGGGVTLYYFKEMGQHPVESHLQNLSKPILVMQGGKDFQVKADVDFVLYKQLLANHPDVTFRLYENLNHCFVPSVYGRIDKAKQEYAVEQHIGDQVISDIANWIHSHC